MIFLDKQHNGRRNRELLERLTGAPLNMRNAIKETRKLFEEISRHPSQYAPSEKQPAAGQSFFKAFLGKFAQFIYTIPARPDLELAAAYESEGHVFPAWKPMLDREHEYLWSNASKEVNVKDFGAAGDGTTDDTEAFKKAIGSGRVKVHVPEGTYIVKEVVLPSLTCLIGEGKGRTIIKLHKDAPKATRLVTNSHHWRGNHHILVQGMSLDWNVERLGNAEKTATWGNHSSCLTYANVKYGWVLDVEGINPGLHCFDVSSTLYNYYGDGYRARGGSQYVWLDGLNGYGFGDDGITTHHSDNILITHCHMCDPSGRSHKKGFSNSNGIEVDDGSKNVWLAYNSTTRCFGGVEIKAHHNSSAASNVQIYGHISINDNRAYNFRHIGHHKSTDPESRTAFNIMASNIVAIAPIRTDLYAGSTPRGLVVSAYKNVAINNFTLIGDPAYDYDKNPVIAIQYRARNVILNNIKIKNFRTAGFDLKVFGGDQRADNVTIENVTIEKSARQAIDIGAGIESASLKNIKAVGENGSYGLKSASPHIFSSGFHANGYKIPLSIAGEDFKTVIHTGVRT